MGEVQISRILAIKAKIGLILHTNRKKGITGVFWCGLFYRKGKRSLKWAYSPSGSRPLHPKSLRRRIIWRGVDHVSPDPHNDLLPDELYRVHKQSDRSRSEVTSASPMNQRLTYYSLILSLSLFLSYYLRKKDSHIRVLAAFTGTGWGKLWGENNLK
jgi:hypothetical protein